MPRVLLVTKSLSGNGLGRVYCLWLVARTLDWDVTVVGVQGTDVWPVLADENEFLRVCGKVAEEPFDAVVAVKPHPETVATATAYAWGAQTPLLIDIDDPDLDVAIATLSGTTEKWRILKHNQEKRHRYFRLLRARRFAKRWTSVVSNPTLQRTYGGVIVPHIRLDPGPPAPLSAERTVAFVGTPRPHKGIDVLRGAVRELAGRWRLVVTADPPEDATEHESWLGTTTLTEGLAVVRTASCVAVLSDPSGFGASQLPVKLIDGMLAGRVVCASALPPITWALGGCGQIVTELTTAAVVESLNQLEDVAVRERIGAAARDRACAMFTPEAVAPTFLASLRSARIPRGVPRGLVERPA